MLSGQAFFRKVDFPVLRSPQRNADCFAGSSIFSVREISFMAGMSSLLFSHLLFSPPIRVDSCIHCLRTEMTTCRLLPRWIM